MSIQHDERLVEGIGADNNGSVLPEAVVAQERCAADGLDDNNGSVLPDAGVAHKRCAVEGVVNVQGLYSTMTQSNVWPQVEPAIDNGDDGLAMYNNQVSIPSVAYVTALKRRINILEQSMRQVALREDYHQDLEQRVKDLEQLVQELMRRLVSKVHMSDGQRSTMGSSYNWGFSCTMDNDHRNVAPYQGNNNNPMMISTGEGQLRNRTVRTQQIMLTQYKANPENSEMPNAGLSNTGVICYSNVIYQALASCNHLTTFFNTPPQKNRECFVLYDAFSQVLHLMVRHQGSQRDVVNPTNFIMPFLDRHSDFRDEQCENSDACKILLFQYGTNMPFH